MGGRPEYSLGKLKGRYVVTWAENGRRRRIRLSPKITQAQARIELDQFVRNRIKVQAREATTIGEIYKQYLADRERDKRPTSKQSVSWKALDPIFGHLAPSQIDKATCVAFREARLGQGRKPGTIWTDLSCLRACLNWARKNKVIAEVPHVFLPPQPKPKDYHITRAEAERFIEACVTPHLKLFVHLALATAGRSSAILELTWDRVDMANRMIDLRTAENRQIKRRAVVPINDTLFDALSDAQSGAMTEWVVEWSGDRVRSIKTAFRKAARRAGLPLLTPHVLRHTAAVWMAEADIPMAVISQYLGHSSTGVTERVYARFSPTYLRAASASLALPKKGCSTVRRTKAAGRNQERASSGGKSRKKK